MPECIALIRGINVGKAKRMAMADLRAMLEGLGHTHVRTLLNSGNAVFRASRGTPASHTRAIEAAIESRFGFSAAVIVLTAATLDEVIAANPLSAVAKEPSRYLVAFVTSPSVLTRARPLLEQRWAPDSLAIGRRAVYLWCGRGILESTLLAAFFKLGGEAATTRNWATVLKLQAAVRSNEGAA